MPAPDPRVPVDRGGRPGGGLTPRGMEADVVVRAQGGDQQAFATLATQSGRRLMALAVGILRDRDMAEDAVQQALLSIWRDLPTLRVRPDSRPGPTSSWFVPAIPRPAAGGDICLISRAATSGRPSSPTPMARSRTVTSWSAGSGASRSSIAPSSCCITTSTFRSSPSPRCSAFRQGPRGHGSTAPWRSFERRSRPTHDPQRAIAVPARCRGC